MASASSLLSQLRDTIAAVVQRVHSGTLLDDRHASTHRLAEVLLQCFLFGVRQSSQQPAASVVAFLTTALRRDALSPLPHLTASSIAEEPFHTDLGRLRWWLRCALNKHLLHSYLQQLLSPACAPARSVCYSGESILRGDGVPLADTVLSRAGRGSGSSASSSDSSRHSRPALSLISIVAAAAASAASGASSEGEGSTTVLEHFLTLVDALQGLPFLFELSGSHMDLDADERGTASVETLALSAAVPSPGKGREGPAAGAAAPSPSPQSTGVNAGAATTALSSAAAPPSLSRLRSSSGASSSAATGSSRAAPPSRSSASAAAVLLAPIAALLPSPPPASARVRVTVNTTDLAAFKLALALRDSATIAEMLQLGKLRLPVAGSGPEERLSLAVESFSDAGSSEGSSNDNLAREAAEEREGGERDADTAISLPDSPSEGDAREAASEGKDRAALRGPQPSPSLQPAAAVSSGYSSPSPALPHPEQAAAVPGSATAPRQEGRSGSRRRRAASSGSAMAAGGRERSQSGVADAEGEADSAASQSFLFVAAQRALDAAFAPPALSPRAVGGDGPAAVPFTLEAPPRPSAAAAAAAGSSTSSSSTSLPVTTGAAAALQEDPAPTTTSASMLRSADAARASEAPLPPAAPVSIGPIATLLSGEPETGGSFFRGLMKAVTSVFHSSQSSDEVSTGQGQGQELAGRRGGSSAGGPDSARRNRGSSIVNFLTGGSSGASSSAAAGREAGPTPSLKALVSLRGAITALAFEHRLREGGSSAARGSSLPAPEAEARARSFSLSSLGGLFSHHGLAHASIFGAPLEAIAHDQHHCVHALLDPRLSVPELVLQCMRAALQPDSLLMGEKQGEQQGLHLAEREWEGPLLPHNSDEQLEQLRGLCPGLGIVSPSSSLLAEAVYSWDRHGRLFPASSAASQAKGRGRAASMETSASTASSALLSQLQHTERIYTAVSLLSYYLLSLPNSLLPVSLAHDFGEDIAALLELEQGEQLVEVTAATAGGASAASQQGRSSPFPVAARRQAASVKEGGGPCDEDKGTPVAPLVSPKGRAVPMVGGEGCSNSSQSGAGTGLSPVTAAAGLSPLSSSSAAASAVAAATSSPSAAPSLADSSRAKRAALISSFSSALQQRLSPQQKTLLCTVLPFYSWLAEERIAAPETALGRKVLAETLAVAFCRPEGALPMSLALAAGGHSSQAGHVEGRGMQEDNEHSEGSAGAAASREQQHHFTTTAGLTELVNSVVARLSSRFSQHATALLHFLLQHWQLLLAGLFQEQREMQKDLSFALHCLELAHQQLLTGVMEGAPAAGKEGAASAAAAADRTQKAAAVGVAAAAPAPIASARSAAASAASSTAPAAMAASSASTSSPFQLVEAEQRALGLQIWRDLQLVVSRATVAETEEEQFALQGSFWKAVGYSSSRPCRREWLSPVPLQGGSGHLAPQQHFDPAGAAAAGGMGVGGVASTGHGGADRATAAADPTASDPHRHPHPHPHHGSHHGPAGAAELPLHPTRSSAGMLSLASFAYACSSLRPRISCMLARVHGQDRLAELWGSAGLGGGEGLEEQERGDAVGGSSSGSRSIAWYPVAEVHSRIVRLLAEKLRLKGYAISLPEGEVEAAAQEGWELMAGLTPTPTHAHTGATAAADAATPGVSGSGGASAGTAARAAAYAGAAAGEHSAGSVSPVSFRFFSPYIVAAMQPSFWLMLLAEARADRLSLLSVWGQRDAGEVQGAQAAAAPAAAAAAAAGLPQPSTCKSFARLAALALLIADARWSVGGAVLTDWPGIIALAVEDALDLLPVLLDSLRSGADATMDLETAFGLWRSAAGITAGSRPVAGGGGAGAGAAAAGRSGLLVPAAGAVPARAAPVGALASSGVTAAAVTTTEPEAVARSRAASAEAAALIAGFSASTAPSLLPGSGRDAGADVAAGGTGAESPPAAVTSSSSSSSSSSLPAPDWYGCPVPVSELRAPTMDHGISSDVLSPEQAALLEASLPRTVQGYRWHLVYSLVKHGASLDTLLSRAREHSPSLLVIKDDRGAVFGCYASEPWMLKGAAGPGAGGGLGRGSLSGRVAGGGGGGAASSGSGVSGAYYGNGQTFVWTFEDRREWDRQRAAELEDEKRAEEDMLRSAMGGAAGSVSSSSSAMPAAFPAPSSAPASSSNGQELALDPVPAAAAGAGAAASIEVASKPSSSSSATAASEPSRFFSLYRSTRRNRYFQVATPDFLGAGGGGGFALYLDSELFTGMSNPCQTFLSPCLAQAERFSCLRLELWSFKRPTPGK